MPVATVAGPLGMRDETHEQFLDRVYGKGAWQAGSEGVAQLVTRPGELFVKIQRPDGWSPQRVDVIAESILSRRDERGIRSVAYGHRDVARYLVEAETTGEITVPLSVMRETGAILVIVSAKRVASGQSVALVETWKHDPQPCEQTILVPDRATAIRMNRPTDRK